MLIVITWFRCLSEAEELPADSVEYVTLLRRYNEFQDVMNATAADWRDCYQLIERYNDELGVAKAHQLMMQEEWTFYRAQSRLRDQQGGGTSMEKSMDTGRSEIN